MRKKEQEIKIKVKFHQAEAGWIDFTITAKEQSFNGVFSYVFDPILDFKYWLEAIATGVQQCSFSFNPEGTEVKFDFNRISWEKEIFTISEYENDKNIAFQAIVKRKQLVKAFYLALYNFSISDKYIPEEWEIEYYKERISPIFGISGDKLIEKLLQFNRKALKELFFEVNPVYDVSFPEANSKTDELKYFIKSVKEDNSTESIEQIRIPKYIKITNQFDLLPTEKRRNLIKELLNTQIKDGYTGIKLSRFKSKRLAKYIYK